MFFSTIMSQAIASIVSTSQVVDAVIARAAGSTKAVAFGGGSFLSVVAWVDGDCDDPTSEEGCLPFDNARYKSTFILTAGYVATLILLLPLGMMNMQENVSSQLVSFVLLVVFLGEFLVVFAMNSSSST